MIIDQPQTQMPSDGEHLATLSEYEDLGEMPDPYNQGKTKRRLKLVWQLEDGAEQWDWVTASLHSQSTLYEIASVLMGQAPPKRLDLDNLIGMRCRIIIKHYQGQDGKTKSKVENYLPAPNGKPVVAGPITDDDVPF